MLALPTAAAAAATAHTLDHPGRSARAHRCRGALHDGGRGRGAKGCLCWRRRCRRRREGKPRRSSAVAWRARDLGVLWGRRRRQA